MLTETVIQVSIDCFQAALSVVPDGDRPTPGPANKIRFKAVETATDG